MQFIRERRDVPLTPELVRELHGIITSETLDHPEDAGRLREEGDQVRVMDQSDGTLLHVPPAAKELPGRMRAMCEFANGGGDGFIHPVVRAVLVHFWLGYDHPFCDGNGRTARALFYWSMLNQGYWLTEYISISRVLKNAPAKYVNSYLHSETWPYDATHFVRFQLEAIQRSIVDLHHYLERKMQQVHQVEAILHNNRDLNHRQMALLSEALRSPSLVITMKSHKETHRVSNETARQDIYKLRDMGLLESWKRGKRLEFTPVKGLEKVLAGL
jgi:Fic family protein